jgi:hypothetical protein
MHDEERLKQKLRAIEALFAGATTPGERDAADRARQRIAALLVQRQGDRVIEWQFTVNPWSKRLLVALARRYGLEPYRYRGQRHTTLVVQASERFLKKTFGPEFDRMCETLYEHLTEVTERVVSEVLDPDKRDEAVVDTQPRQLELVVAPPLSAK